MEIALVKPNDQTSKESYFIPSHPKVEEAKKGKKILQAHTSNQMLDQNFSRRLTRSQEIELDQVIKRIEILNMYGDENDHESKDDVVNYALLTSVEIEPSNYDQTCTNELLLKAMEEEIYFITKNEDWDLMEIPKGKKHVVCKWVDKTKYNVDGSI